MNILYIMSRSGRTGPNVQLLGLLEHLDRTRFSPLLVSLSPKITDGFERELQATGVEIIEFDDARWRGLPALRRLRRLVASRDIDIVHSYGLRPDLLNVLSSGKARTFMTLHNDPFDDYPMLYGDRLGRLMARLHCCAARRADRAVAVSTSIAAAYSSYGVSAWPVPNGIRVDRYTPASLERKLELRRTLGVPADRTVIISTGDLIPRKDPETLLTAFRALRELRPVHLMMLGDGPLMERCRAYGLPDISFVGRVPDVVPYLQAADIFCSTSLSEGLPNAVMEAAACALALCLSDIAAHRELLADGPDVGILCPAQNAQRFAAALDRLAGADRGALSRCSRELAMTHMNARLMAQRYQDLYCEFQ